MSGISGALVGCGRSNSASTTQPASAPTGSAAQPSVPEPLVVTDIRAENLKYTALLYPNGTITPDWDRSQAMGTYTQECGGHQASGKILGMASIRPDGSTTKPSFVISGTFFLQVDGTQAHPVVPDTSSGATIDTTIWVSTDAKSQLVSAHGSAYILLDGYPEALKQQDLGFHVSAPSPAGMVAKGEPGDFKPVTVLASTMHQP